MRTRRREIFGSVHSEGALLPPDLLERIASGDSQLEGLQSDDYHLASEERLNEAVNRSWNVLQGHWKSFRAALERLPERDLATTPTRERWLLPLFQELGYGRLPARKAPLIEGKTYPISHRWHHSPIHLVGARIELDRRS
ncbi:MAG: hypothetical protein ACE5JX_22195, partial [Acidobacteriota bacterium]